MANKLYPPLIEGTIPAFCKEYNSMGVASGATIAVPFTMNSTVSSSTIGGFVLRLRTASSGSYVIPPIYSSSFNVSTQIVNFRLTAD
jgi:hypothetical protein